MSILLKIKSCIHFLTGLSNFHLSELQDDQQKSTNISEEMPGAKQALQRDRSYVKED